MRCRYLTTTRKIQGRGGRCLVRSGRAMRAHLRGCVDFNGSRRCSRSRCCVQWQQKLMLRPSLREEMALAMVALQQLRLQPQLEPKLKPKPKLMQKDAGQSRFRWTSSHTPPHSASVVRSFAASLFLKRRKGSASPHSMPSSGCRRTNRPVLFHPAGPLRVTFVGNNREHDPHRHERRVW